MLTVLNKLKSDFFILNDGSMCEKLYCIETFVKRYFYSVSVVDLSEYAKLLFNNSSSLFEMEDLLIIGLGQGGVSIVNFLSNELSSYDLIRAKWSRVWGYKCHNHFCHDLHLYDLRRRNIIIVEDVIASGETIEAAIKYVKEQGGNIVGVMSAIISGTSPLHNKAFDLPIIVGASLESVSAVTRSDEFISHWFPGIYSLRHLLWGEVENPNFYSTLSNYYFNGDDVKSFFSSQRG